MRKRRGSAIAETGPALFMFLILIFFPLLDVMGMAAQYACCWYHNHMMLQELPVRLPTEAGAVKAEVKARFDTSGLPQFAAVTSITDDVVYNDHKADGDPSNDGEPATVRCTTTLVGRPYVAIPFLGFTKTQFTISGTATQEVRDRGLIAS
jgi:hypothetical protein